MLGGGGGGGGGGGMFDSYIPMRVQLDIVRAYPVSQDRTSPQKFFPGERVLSLNVPIMSHLSK